jgi:hypothetical protein
MNVNFKPSENQGKSLFFGKSDDGKKTLLRPVNLPSAPEEYPSSSSSSSSSSSELLSEVDIYINNIESIDGQALEENVKHSIRNFVSGCQQDNIWDSIKSCCILAGARTLSGALVPLKGAAPTNFNFTSSDYSRISGLRGDAATKYINTNRAVNVDLDNSKHASIYASESTFSPAAYSTLMGVTEFPKGVIFLSTFAPWTSLVTSIGANDNSLKSNIAITGFIGMNRSNNDNYNIIINNLTETLQTPIDLPMTSLNIYLFASNQSNNQPQWFSNPRISFYSIGESIDLSLLQSRVNTLMNDFQQIN